MVEARPRLAKNRSTPAPRLVVQPRLAASDRPIRFATASGISRSRTPHRAARRPAGRRCSHPRRRAARSVTTGRCPESLGFIVIFCPPPRPQVNAQHRLRDPPAPVRVTNLRGRAPRSCSRPREARRDSGSTTVATPPRLTPTFKTAWWVSADILGREGWTGGERFPASSSAADRSTPPVAPERPRGHTGRSGDALLGEKRQDDFQLLCPTRTNGLGHQGQVGAELSCPSTGGQSPPGLDATRSSITRGVARACRCVPTRTCRG